MGVRKKPPLSSATSRNQLAHRREPPLTSGLVSSRTTAKASVQAADRFGSSKPNRSAACTEALAVVRELTNPEVSGGSRRWASWFLEVADESGGFFRTPIGHPALEVVTRED